jgi:hypothetical protein
MISRLVLPLKGSEEVELIGLVTPVYMVVNWEIKRESSTWFCVDLYQKKFPLIHAKDSTKIMV